MLTYIIRRLLIMIPLLLAVSVVGFFIMQQTPGSYLSTLKMNPEVSQEMVNQLREDYGLDEPVWVQYGHWLWRALHFDFGRSFKWDVPVSHVLKTRLLNTLILSLSALLFSWIIAIPIGVFSATHKYQISDNIMTVFAFIGLSIPNFFLALILLVSIVKSGIQWPISGMTSMNYDFLSPAGKVLDVLKHLVVPTIVLGTAAMARVMRQMRGQMLDQLGKDYIKTARAKGVSEGKVIYKHAFRNAVNPLITILGFDLSRLLSGAALTEIVTGWPGLGNMMLNAVRSKDLYVAMAGLMMSSVLLILGNLFADVLLAVVDPRIRYD